MRFFWIFILTCSFYSGSSQGFRVRHYLPGVKTHLSKGIFETAPGNYIAGGFIVDSVKGVYCNRLCLTGLNAQGQIQWIKKYGDAKFQYLNNPFICRTFYKQGNFQYFAGCARDSNNKQVGVLIKFNLNGDTLWQKIYRDPDPLEDVIPQMVTGSVDGGFFITGFFQSNTASAYRKSMLIKTDINGNELWRKKIGKIVPDVSDGKAIIQDSASKKVIITGYQYIGSSVSANIYGNLITLDSLGNNPSRFSFGYYGGMLLDIIQTKDKKFVSVGVAYSNQTVGGNSLERSYIIKFDINNPGVPIWKIDAFDNLSLNNGFTSITELSDENLLIGGILDTLQLHNIHKNLMTRIIKMDKNGNVLWKNYYNYKLNAYNADNNHTIKSLNLTSDGGYVAAIECANFPSPNPFFFVKYDSLGCDTTEAYCQMIAAGLGKNYVPNSGINIYPNPGNGLYYLGIPNSENSKTELIISDLTGRALKRFSFMSQQEKQLLDLQELANGTYIVTVIKDNQMVYTNKLIKKD